MELKRGTKGGEDMKQRHHPCVRADHEGTNVKIWAALASNGTTIRQAEYEAHIVPHTWQ